ncbi:MAG: DUF1345 domain-containing protein [Mesorhizobium amorphae]|nr:MAG: DUF1345 domain-containing protein [Mesorhizobium amorphae]
MAAPRPHLAFVVSALLGLGGSAIALQLRPEIALSFGASLFLVAFLASLLRQLARMTPDFLRRHARQADEPATVILLVTVIVVATAFVSLFQLVNQKGAPDTLNFSVSLLAVVLGWLAIQAMFAVHYAHLCWVDHAASLARGEAVRRDHAAGLEFPGDAEPGGWDFLYFSATIGMTAQTADVDTTTTRLRRVVLGHGLLSFFFNAVIVAAAVNIAVSLGD